MKKNVFVSFYTERHCLLKQCLATVVSGWLSLTTGLAMGFSATLLPALEEEKTFSINKSVVSWIASITALSMVIGCLCAGPLIDGLGRKAGHISLAILSLISWFILGFAKGNTLLLIGRFIAGLSIGANRPVSLVYLGEITEPKYRSLLLLSPSVFLSISIIISHLLGGYIYWRTCCFIYAGSNFVAFLLLLTLKESPIWLISRGKVAEGKQFFIWLRGKGIEAERELNLILQRQEERINNYYFKDILNLRFMKALISSLCLAVAGQFCGVNLFVFYAIEISRSTFKGDIDPFILMIVLDVVRFSSVVINLGCNRYIASRKTSFLIMNVVCSIGLLSLFIYFLHTFRSIYLSVTLAVLYIASGSSIVSLAWSFIPELFPSTLRGLGSGIASSLSYILLFVIVKIYPGFNAMFGQEIIFISFAVLLIINSVILYFLLPETNGRTLQDLEDSYNNKDINKY